MIKFASKMTRYRFLLSLVLSMMIGHACALTIDSLRVAATLDEARFTDGTLHATFFTDAASAVDYSLADVSGSVVASGSLPYVRNAADRKLDIEVKNVRRWSDETPCLYVLSISAKDKNGSVCATVSHSVGFRVVATRYGKFYVNGLTPSLRGVNANRLLAGSDRQRMLELITLLKRNNLNAVRTDCIDERWLGLCDEQGIYVCPDVSSFRKAGTADKIADLYRVANHPSVVLWSTEAVDGNDSDAVALSKLLKSMPGARPVMFAGVAAATIATDVYFPKSISPKEADAFCNSAFPLHEKPLVIDELVRTGGNGYGGVDEWVQMLGKYSRFAGFFLPEGAVSDMENGPAPGIVELAYQLNRVRILSQAPRVGRLSLCNDNLSKPLSDVALTWQVVSNGTVVSEGTCSAPDVKAGNIAGINLKLADLAKAYPAGELALNVYCRLDKAQGLLPKGHELARSQFVIRSFRSLDTLSSTLPAVDSKLKIKEKAGLTSISNARCKVVFDTKTGFMCQYNVGGVDLLSPSVQFQPNFWRTPTDNDLASGADSIYSLWRNPDMQLQSIAASKVVNPSTGRKDVCVKTQYALSVQKVSLTISYTVSEDGSVLVRQSASMLPGSTSAAIAPRFGMALIVSDSFSNVRFFGRGPLENYCDRKQSQFVGEYLMPVNDMGWCYSHPQENGLRTDLRWIRLTDNAGHGLEIKSRNLFSASASHMGDTSEMVHGVRLCLDSAQMGVGDYVNGGEYPQTFSDTRVFFRKLDFSFLLCPLVQ